MPIDNTIFRDHLRLRDQQRAERERYARNHSLSSGVPLINFDGPSDRTRPRHHFRRGAISEASGRPYLPIFLPFINREQAVRQQQITQQSHTVHSTNLSNRSFTDRRPLVDISTYRPTISQLRSSQRREQVVQIHHRLVTPYLSRFQERMSWVVLGVPGETDEDQIDGLAPQSSSRIEHSNTHRDTHRYGRDGWSNPGETSTTSSREATIPGSYFAVPHSTLNLFQSVDLFAPPRPEPSDLANSNRAYIYVLTQCIELENTFNEAVEARRMGVRVRAGLLFATSMELSRLKQLKIILEEEFLLFLQAGDRARDRVSRRLRRTLRGTNGLEGLAEEESTDEQDVNMEEDDNSSTSGAEEPEGWSNLGFVFDGEYPQEVCFHIGSQLLTYPVEEVEDWMMDERRQSAWSSTSLATMPHVHHGVRHIMHTLSMPEPPQGLWINNPRRAYPDLDDEYEDDEDDVDYTSEDYFADHGESFHDWANRQPRDQHGTGLDEVDDFGEEEDEADEADEEVEANEADEADHEILWHDGSLDDLLSAQQTPTAGGINARSMHSTVPAFVLDFTNAPSLTQSPSQPDSHAPANDPSGSASTSQANPRSHNTSDESNPATITSTQTEDSLEPAGVHPITNWSFQHTLYMYSCRGSIFDVATRLQSAFGFLPPVTPQMVGERLNGESAARHRSFILAMLPGEVGTEMRASRRAFLHAAGLADHDLYHGTQEVVEGDPTREDYPVPPMPYGGPPGWSRAMDIELLRELMRGHFTFSRFGYQHLQILAEGRRPEELPGFLALRLAQVRYLNITGTEMDPDDMSRGGESVGLL